MISLSPPTICNSAPPHGRLTHAASLDPLGHGAGHLLALPESRDDLIRYYTFNDSDLSLIRQRRGDANRLGFAVQLCLLRYPGYALGTDSELPEPVILWVAKQVRAEPASWAKYGERDVTRREHARELRTYLQLAPFGLSDFRAPVRELTELAQQTDKGLLLAGQALESLRQKRRILPALSVIDRACSEAIARANRRVYRAWSNHSRTRIGPSWTSC